MAGMIVLASCSWANPGAHKMHGSTESAVANYTDIPVAAQDEIRSKIAKVKPDDIAYIYKDITVGRGAEYDYSAPRDMHFGIKSVCREVKMNSWSDDHYEIALVYCSGEFCLMVPRACHNVSRVYRKAALLGEARKAPVTYSSPRAGRPTHHVPEPSSAALSLTALLAVGLLRFIKGKKQ